MRDRSPFRLLLDLNPRPVDIGSERALGGATTGMASPPDAAVWLEGLGPKR